MLSPMPLVLLLQHRRRGLVQAGTACKLTPSKVRRPTGRAALTDCDRFFIDA